MRTAASVPCDFSPVSYMLSKRHLNHVVPEIEKGAQLETRPAITQAFDKTQCSQNILGDLWQLKKQLGIFQKSEQPWRGLRRKLQRFLWVSSHAASQSVLCITIVLAGSTGRHSHGGVHPVSVEARAWETERTAASQPITRGVPHTQR